MKSKVRTILCLLFMIEFVALQVISAVDFNQPISAEDQATFDQILDPILKIYNLVKYSATVIAVVVLLFAGVTYMLSGENPAKREQAKNMVAYVVVGLIVIWIAPLLVNFVVG